MKKSLLALAVLGAFAGVASAQSSVTLYGKIDLGWVNEGGAKQGSVNRLDSGISGGSRIGLRGAEDLGGGLKAIFTAETGFCADANNSTSSPLTTGNNPAGFCTGGNAFMGRQAFVGLDGGFGKLTLGRQYTPQFLLVTTADPFGTGYEGNIGNVAGPQGSLTSLRQNNAVIYSTPNLSGFGASLMYGFGEKAGSTSAGQALGLSLGYNNGPLGINYAYNQQKNVAASVPPGGAFTSTDSLKLNSFSASYDFGAVKPVLLYHTAKNGTSPAAVDFRLWMLGLTAPLGAGNLMFSYARADDRTALNLDADQFAIGYQYQLSKRTGVHVSYAKIKNKNGADGVFQPSGATIYTVGNATETGTGDRGFALGVVHNF